MFSRWVEDVVDESTIPIMTGSETNLKVEY